MNICVTGGAGFIGSHLTDRLIEEGHRVLVIDNLFTGSREFVNAKADFREMDIRDTALTGVLLEFKPDYVFHEAAQTMVPVSMEKPALDCDINLMGLINILNACRAAHVKKLIMPSSAAVYGDLDTLPLTEAMQGAPSSFYGLTKLTTESYLRIYKEAFGLDYICFRYSNVYGPRQGHGGEGGVISIFCERLAKGQGVTVYGDGEQTRDFIYVGDVVEANMLALQHTECSGVYNVSTEVGTSLNTLLNELKDIIGTDIDVTYEPTRTGDIKHSRLSIKKSNDGLGFRAKIDLTSGLKTTYHYFADMENFDM